MGAVRRHLSQVAWWSGEVEQLRTPFLHLRKCFRKLGGVGDIAHTECRHTQVSYIVYIRTDMRRGPFAAYLFVPWRFSGYFGNGSAVQRTSLCSISSCAFHFFWSDLWRLSFFLFPSFIPEEANEKYAIVAEIDSDAQTKIDTPEATKGSRPVSWFVQATLKKTSIKFLSCRHSMFKWLKDPTTRVLLRVSLQTLLLHL